MCGFAVMMAVGGRPANASAVRRMTTTLRHRGPDDEGIYVNGPVGFGFRRLSILDLSPSGHQPMVSDDGTKVLVFNGEIYNYVELREELRALGHSFRSSGDTEVLLRAYEQWGSDCLSKLNGMWAFVIYDWRRRVLFGSRDRFGVKPLYCYRSAQHVMLSSEVKGILASGYCDTGTNWEVASRFLLYRRLDEDDQTFHASIDQVSPGSAFEVDATGGVKQWKFWTLGAAEVPVSDPSRQFFDQFQDSVRLRMRSDVPVGVCLSGGLDSSSILALTARQRREAGADGPLQAFCYASAEFDESRYVAESLKASGAHVNRVTIDPRRLWDNLPKALWHYDEPVHSASALIGFELMRLAANRGVRVVLNGQGADETLGGYHSYFPAYWQTLLSEGRVAECWREIAAYARVRGEAPLPLFRLVARQTIASAARRLTGRGQPAPSARRNSWFTPEFAATVTDAPSNSDTRLDSALRFSVERRRLPLFLRVEDRNSMAHSVEARLPFLDYRLVNLAFSLPAHWKMRGPWNKFVLREAMRGHIPELVRSRIDKMGFPTSVSKWVKHEWYEPFRDLVASRAMRERGIYRIDAIVKDLEAHREGRLDCADALFQIAQFELWSTARQVAEEPPAAVQVR
jgi:asparagine synthase (glutamine-hydrolysing)